MKVLLVKDVAKLGRSGDIKEVPDGYARNFLLAKKLALPATNETVRKAEKEKSESAQRVKKEQEKNLELKNKLENKTFTIKGKASNNKLFASVRESEITAVINDKLGSEIEADQIIIEQPVKNLGLNEVKLKLAGQIIAKIKINVEAG